MDAEFWLQRWREQRIGFHQNRITPPLEKFWPTLGLHPGSRVLVPLCGKSLDMLWLARQGHSVLGVELSELAVEQFFAENELSCATHTTASGKHYVAGEIEIICGDIFDLDPVTLSRCQGVFDRAALVALPESMRGDYVQAVYSQLAEDYQGLLVTLDYPQGQMQGPPFSVDDAQVQSLFAAAGAQALLLDRRDMLDKEPKFAEQGVERLESLVYRLQRRL
ncbi:thiopurine S-methyltransferase [Orrella sp. JC864]|uniref:thiopurine S-methyltransferase n=1 Tax=Orrella sp. JC864 TaxID=3120298 RepID=UPI0030088621